MKNVDINNIPDNAVLARSVINDNGVVLLNEGVKITAEIVSKLMDNKINSVWVTVETTEVDSFSTEIINDDIRISIEQAIGIKIRFNDDSEMKDVSEETYNIIKCIIEDDKVMDCMLEIKKKSTDIYTHMIDVSVLSVIMGLKLKLSNDELKIMGLGALLHDIGLCDIDMDIYDIEIKEEASSEKMKYRRHVIQGYELINNLGWVPEMAKTIVLSHHEREDGSGYPFHKKGERIPIEVKIVSVCDYFDELVNGIGHRKRKINEVVEYLRTAGAYLFDCAVVNKIITNIAWFPNNSHVITNEGDEAIVVAQNKGLPDRPVIRLLRDESGNPYRKDIIKDLTESLTLFITDTIE